MRSVPMILVVACTTPATTPSTPGTTPTGTTPTLPAGPTTAEQLAAFYDASGGRDAFPAHTVAMVEALLHAEDEVMAGDLGAARARIDAVFETYPLSTDIWAQDATWGGLNVGNPIAYYGLRMLDLVASEPAPTATGTLQLTAVVAPCASVTRPTLGGGSETVELDVHPDILADDARTLHEATRLFRRWVTTITAGLEVSLVVHELGDCNTTVDFTDDGSVVVSYPDAQAMIGAVPDAVADATDFWWVVAPSGVPGDGSGFERHFITGGMGVHGAGLPLFLSDDGWFVRKPEHLGSGPYSDVERRVYQPQWFQHEFMHHLFRTWPEFGLESSSHQWFDRSTWPKDFEGRWEPDYYAEAITKRLLGASPSLAEALAAPEPVHIDDAATVLGAYARLPIENDWHRVTISDDPLTWSNEAGVSWSLVLRDGSIHSGPDCPYGEAELIFEVDDDDDVTAYVFLGERYRRQPD